MRQILQTTLGVLLAAGIYLGGTSGYEKWKDYRRGVLEERAENLIYGSKNWSIVARFVLRYADEKHIDPYIAADAFEHVGLKTFEPVLYAEDGDVRYMCCKNEYEPVVAGGRRRATINWMVDLGKGRVCWAYGDGAFNSDDISPVTGNTEATDEGAYKLLKPAVDDYYTASIHSSKQ
jgi:hypothetical protein